MPSPRNLSPRWHHGSTLVAALAVVGLTACSTQGGDRRALNVEVAGSWSGNGIGYSPFRDGQGPEEIHYGLAVPPTKQQILEDLRLLVPRWRVIRLYGSDEMSRRVLEVIRDNHLPLKVMLGAYVTPRATQETNHRQVREAILQASEFKDIVNAVAVGNEVFASWTTQSAGHVEWLASLVRWVRRSVTVPVTVADVEDFWARPEADALAVEVDFICLHAYAFWSDADVDDAARLTQERHTSIGAAHPDVPVALCEYGWPTAKAEEGMEGAMRGQAGEAEQDHFFQATQRWLAAERVPSFYFEAFDEQWKGETFEERQARPASDRSADLRAEKHWGLFRRDRSPKLAAQKAPVGVTP